MFIEYKQGEKHAGKNAARSESMDTFQDCGMLLTNEEVVIDIDHLPKESIKAMIAEFGIKTQTVWTDRGVHLWFLKPAWFTKKFDGVCRLGIEIEQHTQGTNPYGMTVKRNGVPRTIENMGARQYLPQMFKSDPRTKYEDMTNMEEGDGRNKKLFEHRMKLSKHNVPDADRILHFINHHVFAEPLEESEVETILRDMPAGKHDSKYLHVVNTIMKECRTILYAGTVWWFYEGEYITDPKNERLKRRVYETCEEEDTRYVDEVIKQISYKSPLIPEGTIFPIRFNNGILRKGKFIAIKDYLDFTPYHVEIDYKEDAAPVRMVDDYIDNLTNKDPVYRDLLMETIGYVMITDPERIRSLGKFFMFRGDGANGKGTLLEIMKRIYNAKNCTNLSIKQLVDDRYKVTMIGKLANLGDDIEAEAINNDQLKVIKNISTADTVSTRFLYGQAITATFTTKLYFTTNSDIRSFEKGYAYKRRVVWLPMFNKVDKPDPNFITKITTKEALEYWIRLIVEGYKRLYQNGKWTECKVVKEYNDQYHEENDVCAQYAKELDPDTEIVGKTVNEIERDFNEWRTDERKFSNKLFKAAVWDLYKIGLGRSKVNGKTRRTFMRQSDTTQKLVH